jgi:hypothetical protein
MPDEIPMRVRNLDKPGAAQALADPTKSGSKKITVAHEFDSAGHAAALFELRSSTRSS